MKKLAVAAGRAAAAMAAMGKVCASAVEAVAEVKATIARDAELRVERQRPAPRGYYSPANAGSRIEIGRRAVARRRLGLRGRCDIPAPVGRNHPDYGMTVAEHLAAKARRAAGAS